MAEEREAVIPTSQSSQSSLFSHEYSGGGSLLLKNIFKSDLHIESLRGPYEWYKYNTHHAINSRAAHRTGNFVFSGLVSFLIFFYPKSIHLLRSNLKKLVCIIHVLGFTLSKACCRYCKICTHVIQWELCTLLHKVNLQSCCIIILTYFVSKSSLV